MKHSCGIDCAVSPVLAPPQLAFSVATNEEASSGGLVCGLQRRVYQDDSSSVHSHRTALSARPQKASGDGRRCHAITAHSPRRQPMDTAPVSQTLPPARRCFAAHPHDILPVARHAAQRSTPYAGGECKGGIALATKMPEKRDRDATLSVLTTPEPAWWHAHRPTAPRLRAARAGGCPHRYRPRPWRPIP